MPGLVERGGHRRLGNQAARPDECEPWHPALQSAPQDNVGAKVQLAGPGWGAAGDGDLRELLWIVPGPREDAAHDEGEVAIDVAAVGQAEPDDMVVEDPGSQKLGQGVPPLAGNASTSSGSPGAARKFLRRPCSPPMKMGTRA